MCIQEKELDKEKGKAFRRHADAVINKENYQRLFAAQVCVIHCFRMGHTEYP